MGQVYPLSTILLNLVLKFLKIIKGAQIQRKKLWYLHTIDSLKSDIQCQHTSRMQKQLIKLLALLCINNKLKENE